MDHDTYKDHATGLTVIRALPRKQAKYVVHELAEQFGLIGYPRIFHTDNGKEFVADLILKLLQETNPNISSVTGRPRTPRDQGSVESMNKLIKKVIAMLESEAEASGKSGSERDEMSPSAWEGGVSTSIVAVNSLFDSREASLSEVVRGWMWRNIFSEIKQRYWKYFA